MKKLVAAATFGLVALQAQAFELKGIEVNKPSSVKALESKFGATCGANKIDVGGSVCIFTSTILGDESRIGVFLSPDGIVSIIQAKFKPSSFDDVKEGLIAKFGKPSMCNESKASTAMGAVVNDETCTWTDAEETKMFLRKYAGKLSEGSVSIATKNAVDKTKAQIDTKKNDL